MEALIAALLSAAALAGGASASSASRAAIAEFYAPPNGGSLTIDLAVGYRSDNPSPVLTTF